MMKQQVSLLFAELLKSLLRQIVANSGLEGSIVVQKVREGKDDFGYNARTDEYVNLEESRSY
jgi:chaperonin GroEL (HSP60 family)